MVKAPDSKSGIRKGAQVRILLASISSFYLTNPVFRVNAIAAVAVDSTTESVSESARSLLGLLASHSHG